MTSLRHNDGPGDHPDPGLVTPPRSGYLDAARACILDVGWRRTTLTEVARRAGVSRMTIYRAWGDMKSLLGDLLTREWGEVVSRARGDHDVTAPEGLARALVSMVRGLRDNELFVRIVELDPELLLPYLIDRRGRSQQSLLDLVGDAIARGQAAGRMRAGHAATAARGIVLAAHGFVLSAHTMTDDAVGLEALDEELRLLVERTLAP